jgi:hypothetical protein
MVVPVAGPFTFTLNVCALKHITISPVPVSVAVTTEFTGTAAAPSVGTTATSAPFGGVALTTVTDTDAVRVTPPEVKLAPTVASWFAVTDGAVNRPAALIVPRFVLQVGVTVVVDASLQVAVAV